MLDADELTRFAAELLAQETDPGSLVPRGWCRHTPSSRVLLVTDREARRWFVKQLERGYKWRRETSAYESWAPVLGDRMPRLVGGDRGRRLLLLAELPGATPASRDPLAYRQAGEALRALHAVETGDHCWTQWCGHLAERVDRELHELARTGVRVEQQVLRRVVDGIGELAPQPLVASHGDFLPRNWVVDGDRLAIMDFAEAGHHPAVLDVAKLHATTMWGRTDLLEQLLAGYGRHLAADEVRLLELVRAVPALALLRRGVARDVPAVVERGRAVLAAVAADRPLQLTRPAWRRNAAGAVRRVARRRVVPPAPDPLLPLDT